MGGTDLLILDDDISLDAGGIPQLVSGLGSIAQDIAHMIREKGLLAALVANRSQRQKAAAMVEITIAVDNDTRIVPGTAAIDDQGLGVFLLTATTVEYGGIEVTLET